MNIKELKKEIMNLAFEEPTSMIEYRDIVIDAINRATHQVHSTVRPVTEKYEIVQEGTDAGIRRYDMKELTKEGGRITFMDFTGEIEWEKPDGSYQKLAASGYRTVDRSVLILDGNKAGTFSVWYKKIPEKITLETPEERELELDYDVQVLIPLLAAHYVWLDEDERKAIMFWNHYDGLKGEILENSWEKAFAVIGKGMRW